MNEALRECIASTGLKQWQIAKILGMREETLSRKLRFEIPEDEQKRMIIIINAVSRDEEYVKAMMLKDLNRIRVEYKEYPFFIDTVEDFLKSIKEGEKADDKGSHAERIPSA